MAIRQILRLSILFVAPTIALCCSAFSDDKSGTTPQETAYSKLYDVPTGDDVAVLVKFIKQLTDFMPNNKEENDEYEAKALNALRVASDRLLKLEKDTSTDAYRLGKLTNLQVRCMELSKASEEEQTKLFHDVLEFIESRPHPALSELGLLVKTERELEKVGSPVTVDACEKFGNILVKHERPQVAEYGKILLGTKRRLTLVGNPLELTGKTSTGESFDVANLKGKVVLVDFWATWCQTCIEEYPHIRALYEKYHDKGFEVVGVNFDKNRRAMEKYLKDKDVPWVTLHEDNEDGQHPAALYYGVEEFPFMALIGRDGKVISTKAIGEDLDRLLAEQFEEKK